MAECPVVELPFGQYLSVFSLSVGTVSERISAKFFYREIPVLYSYVHVFRKLF